MCVLKWDKSTPGLHWHFPHKEYVESLLMISEINMPLFTYEYVYKTDPPLLSSHFTTVIENIFLFGSHQLAWLYVARGDLI